MKKLLLSATLACSLFAASDVYTDVVKPIFADESSTKSIGRLLPTNAVKITQESKDKVKITIRGYKNPTVNNVIYYSDSQRVIAAAFSKTANVQFNLVEKGKGGKWDKVEVSVYTTKGDFTSDLAPMFARADQMYKDNCGICHTAHATDHYKANQWPGLIKSMLSRTAIDKKDEWLITQYLQKHSSDVK
ncbi:cytochrome C [Campylobacter sp. RM16192]|uniref:cytochrome C n=1 Tax=Campylobacter sp. RM16192 TaxID=1660080 RepID=UPI0014510988|nr:cytochrome C [Campylobacter sp. RM16192]QCD52531.1 molybdopterin-containing oxidoreductase II, DMSO/TMAO/BSO reductase family, monoheme c-type cytochrome [Campylobacter sp. RM16192]